MYKKKSSIVLPEDTDIINDNNWLDIKISGSSIEKIKFSNDAYEYMKIFSFICTNLITDFSYMFSNCTSLLKLNIDTSNGTDFSYMMYGCESMREITLNTVNGTNFSNMFCECISLKGIILNTSNGTDFSYMFSDCTSLETISLNTPNGINFNGMFRYCNSLKSVSTISVNNGTDFGDMFSGCYRLKNIPTLNTVNGTNFSYMFNDCESIRNISIDTTNGIDLTSIFRNCLSLNSINLDTTSMIHHSGMFQSCKSLKTITGLDTSNLTDFSYMFNDCESLREIPYLNTSNGTLFNGMFQNCKVLRTITGLDVSNGTDFGYMFNGCNLLQEIPSLNTINGTNFISMFSNCSIIRSVSLDTTNAEDMSWMFTRSGIVKINGLNFENCKYATGMFYECNKIDTFNNYSDFRDIDTNHMFRKSSIESVKGLIVNGGSMFTECTSLQKLDLQGIHSSMDLSSCKLSSKSLNLVFDKLVGGLSGRNLNIGFNHGLMFHYKINQSSLETYQTSIPFTANSNYGSKVLLVSNTFPFKVGMYVTGMNVSSPVSYLKDDETIDNITTSYLYKESHGLSNGTPISFTSSPGDGLIAYTIYYVVNTSTDRFSISTVVNGAPLRIMSSGRFAPTVNGLCSPRIVSIDPNNSITLSTPANTTAFSSFNARELDIITATMKGFTLTF